MGERVTDGIRRACGIAGGLTPNEFAEATVRKAAVAEECDRLDEGVEAARYDAWEKGFETGKGLEKAGLFRRVLPPEDAEAVAWVRDHGGLDAVRRRLGWVVGHCSTERQLDFDFWLSGRVMHELGFEEDMADRDEVERRLLSRFMPEGYEWPKVDGEPVVIGERMRSCGIDDCKVVGIDPENARLTLASDDVEKGKATYFADFAKDCHRPAPKVLDADGVEIEVGDDLYSVEGGLKLHVGCIDTRNGKIATTEMYAFDKWADPAMYTHRAPVLAADGIPLREGETVWEVETGDGYVVERIYSGTTEPDFPGHTVACRRPDDIMTHMFEPSQLTHERTDSWGTDSWERLEEGACKDDCEYFGRDMNDCKGCPASRQDIDDFYCDENEKARDLVRRARALAGDA